MDDYSDLSDDDLAGLVIDAYISENLHRVNAVETDEEADGVLDTVEAEASDMANSPREDQIAYLRGE